MSPDLESHEEPTPNAEDAGQEFRPGQLAGCGAAAIIVGVLVVYASVATCDRLPSYKNSLGPPEGGSLFAVALMGLALIGMGIYAGVVGLIRLASRHKSHTSDKAPRG